MPSPAPLTLVKTNLYFVFSVYKMVAIFLGMGKSLDRPFAHTFSNGVITALVHVEEA